MRSIYKLLVLVCFTIFSGAAMAQEDFSQQLLERIQRGDNFFSIQKFAQSWFSTHSSGKGSGYKQYKRWEYDMSFQVSGNGELPGGKQNANQQKAQDFIRSQPQEFTQFNTGASWTNLSQAVPVVSGGKNSGAGRVNSWAFEPGTNNVMLGTPMGGMWRGVYLQGTDSYLWAAYGDALPNPGILQVCYNYNNTNIIYALTGGKDAETRVSAGVIKSVDAGLSWQPTGLKMKENQAIYVRKLLMHPSNPECLFVVAQNMLIRTLNGGNNWDTLSYDNFSDLVFKPGTSRLYGISRSGAFYYSDDLGEHLTVYGAGLPATGNYNIKIGVTPAAPETIYLLYGGGQYGFHRLMRSTNGGDNFFIQSFGNPNTNPLGYCDNGLAECGYNTTGQVFRNCEIAVSPTNAASVFVGGINVWESDNAGINWTIRAKWEQPNAIGYAHADIHSLEVRNDHLYCGSDGGFYRMNLSTKLWKPFSDNLPLAQVYRVGGSSETQLFWGCQDNGVNEWKAGSYKHVICCDGTSSVQAPTNSNIVYASIQEGSFKKSSDAGVTFPTSIFPPTQLAGGTNCNCDDTTGGAWVTPIVVSPTNSSKLYIGYRRLYTSLNGGTSWTKTDLPSTTEPITAMAISPQDDNVVYMARNTYRIFRTIDGAATVDELSILSTALKITAITVDPANKNHIYVSIGGYNNGHKVYEGTVDANGVLTWTNITGNLPNMPFYSITTDAGNGIYVGGDIGVYYRNNQTNGWLFYGNGLPNTSVRDLRIISGKLHAATFGRGVWKTGLFVTCPANYNHDSQSGLIGVNGQEFYQASNSITTNVSVTGGVGAAVVYKAGNYVDLKPGFRATYGTAMVSQVLPCNTVGFTPANLVPLTGN